MKQDVTRKQGRIEFIYELFFFFYYSLRPGFAPIYALVEYIFFDAHEAHECIHSYTSLLLYINKIIFSKRISRKRQKENIFQ